MNEKILVVSIVLLTLVCLGSGGAAETRDLYVAVDGNDANPGTAERPFATLRKAQEAARAIIKEGLDRDLHVIIGDGRYPLDAPLRFGPEDSGDSRAVVWRARPAESPVISGGRTIAGWKKTGDRWTTEIPDVKAGKWHFRQLFVNGQRRPRARAPNDGFFRVVKPGADDRTGFRFQRGDIKNFGNLGEAEILFLHDWSVSRIAIASVDEAKDLVVLKDPIGAKSPALLSISGFEPQPRYAVENAIELLDAPGEWHLDRKTGLLTYCPMPGETPETIEAVAPVLDLLLEAKSVRRLHFEGLTFAHAEWRLPAHGLAEIQAGFREQREGDAGGRMPAAVVFDAASDCAMTDCLIVHVGGTAISLQNACRKNEIARNEIRDVGGNGVMVGEAGKAPNNLAKENVVARNVIRDCGQIVYGCVGIWCGITEGTQVIGNEISHLPYTGISVGWQWNKEPTPCRANIVADNHIFRVMQILSDGGGIYTLGRQPGTILRGNLIHDIPVNAGRAESNGMFIDEGSSELSIEENTIYGVARAPIRFHKAGANTIRNNNLLPAAGQSPFAFNACEEKAMTFVKNNVVAGGVTWRADPEKPEFLKKAEARIGYDRGPRPVR